jgi:acetoin utilization protein AcuB
MLVKQYMTRHPILIEPHRRVVDAQRIMAENRVRHLPVVTDGKRLLGLLTRQRLQIAPERLSSLDVWEITRLLTDLTVDQVMAKGTELKAISPEAPLEEAAAWMMKYKIGGLPVVEEGDIVVGLITDTNILYIFQQLLGAYDPGWRLTVRVPARRGEFGKLYSAIIDKGWGVMAMGSSRSPKEEEHWDMMIKVRGPIKAEDLQLLVNGLEGQKILDLRETIEHATSF